MYSKDCDKGTARIPWGTQRQDLSVLPGRERVVKPFHRGGNTWAKRRNYFKRSNLLSGRQERKGIPGRNGHDRSKIELTSQVF